MEQQLLQSLEKLGFKANLQEKTNQVVTTFTLQGYDYPVFLRSLDGGNLLQMLTFVPCTLQQTAVQDTSRLLHMINKELDMPGFCCDEDSKTVFYRIVIPCINKQLDEPLFGAYMNATQQICGMFGTIVQAIAVGAMTLEEMLEKAKEKQASRKST